MLPFYSYDEQLFKCYCLGYDVAAEVVMGVQATEREFTIGNVCSAQVVVQAHSAAANRVASQAVISTSITVACGVAMGQNRSAYNHPPSPLPLLYLLPLLPPAG